MSATGSIDARKAEKATVAIKKHLIAEFRARPIRWAAGDVDILVFAGLAVRGALLEMTGTEPYIRHVARIAFRHCFSQLPSLRARPRKTA